MPYPSSLQGVKNGVDVKQNSLSEKDDRELIKELAEADEQFSFHKPSIVGDRPVNALAMGAAVMELLLGGVSLTNFLE